MYKPKRLPQKGQPQNSYSYEKIITPIKIVLYYNATRLKATTSTFLDFTKSDTFLLSS